MNLSLMAQSASRALSNVRKVSDLFDSYRETNGLEVYPGFFNVYNEDHGQSADVVFHPASELIFKWFDPEWQHTRKGEYIAEVILDSIARKVRFPFEEAVQVKNSDLWVLAQEYVRGYSCSCPWGCEHDAAMKAVTYADAHCGNWKINQNGEVVLFDHEGWTP